MSWFTSLFSSDSSRRKNQAMPSTHDAFSLPTSSPTFANHSDAIRNDTPFTPEPESATSPFTYPPPSAGSIYDYMPTSSGSRSKAASLLPVHNKPLSPLPPYPPLAKTWHRLRTWLAKEYPELGDTLNYGILPQDLAQIEMQFGFELPAPVRESYLIVDGQEPESAAGCSEGLFFGLTLLPLEDVLEEWRFWRDVDDDPTTGANPRLREAMHSIPASYVRREYSSRGWIPLVGDKAGNYLGVDLNPGEAGAVGQVIVFGREFDTKVVMWRGDGQAGWAKWLASFVEELESGEGYELGSFNDGSEGAEDDVGYESYFYDGVGRGQGDGGGDSGTGGIRLAGEYRGWSVLEAWADRSVKKWLESGCAIEPSVPQEKGKGPESTPFGVLDLATVSKESGAEVPIPVLAEVDESSALAPLDNMIDKSERSTVPRQPLPTISVTKPPAPLPVILPTQQDISSSPDSPDSDPSSPADDLEAGHHMMMREVDRQPKKAVTRSKASNSPNGLENAINASQTTALSGPSSSASAAVMSDITDLLTEPAPALDAQPMEPVSRSPSKSPARELVAQEIPTDAGSPSTLPTDGVEESAPGDASESADATIRLVGGGGISGTSDESFLSQANGDVQGDAEPEGSEVASATSADSIESTTKTPANHGKKKSISSGLKKIGQLGGGKRKKDSNSSMKETL